MARRSLKGFVVPLVVGLLALPTTIVPLMAAEPDPARIAVYNININKMDREWEKWVDYISHPDQGFAVPDLILVQDMENEKERLDFQGYLKTTFGGEWHGRAGASGAHGWHTAVVWNGDRFDASTATSRGWWGFGDAATRDGDPVCLDAPDGAPGESNNGSPAVQVRLADKLSENRYVSAVSFKTSGGETPKTCAWSNLRKVNFKLQQADWTGDIMVLGTDANSSDRTSKGAWRCWYRGSNANIPTKSKLGCGGQRNQRFYDPIFEKCKLEAPLRIKRCLKKHSTRKEIRIDFVMAKLSSGAAVTFSLEETDTLPWNDGDAPAFTDHRTHRTVIYY